MRATATLTFDYADQTAAVGPLSPEATPGAYDLCDEHADSLSVPRGWRVVRVPRSPEPAPVYGSDDLFTLAESIRAVGLAGEELPQAPGSPSPAAPVVELGRRGHLRVIADAPDRPSR